MHGQVKRELGLLLAMMLTAVLLTGCSSITKITLNEDGSGSYEESSSISKKLWDLSVTELGNDETVLSYLRTLYPQASIDISDETVNGVESKVLKMKMGFKDTKEFQQALSSTDIMSVKFNPRYFTRTPIYMPLEEEGEQGTSTAEELQALLGSDEQLMAEVAEEMKNMEVKMTVTFPYEVTGTNGTIQEDGKTVIWDVQQMDKDAERLYALFQATDSAAAPTYTGAANGKDYNTGVTVVVDSENLLRQVVINGEATEKDYLFLSAEGVYTISATDINGNSSQIKFRIDTTKPSISGVANNKVYKSARTVKFADKGSGIKKATLNGKTVKSGKKVTAKGKYTLAVTDKAGNKKTVKFTIK